MTNPPEAQHSIPPRWPRVFVAVVVALGELAVHVFTLGRVASWLPGYPSIVVFGLLTPPAPIRALHKFGPFLLVVALGAVILASVGPARFRQSRPTLFRAGGGTILFLLGLYSWALLWVLRASRYVG